MQNIRLCGYPAKESSAEEGQGIDTPGTQVKVEAAKTLLSVNDNPKWKLGSQVGHVHADFVSSKPD